MNIDSVLYVFILYLVCQKLCLDIIGIPEIYMTRVIAVGNIYHHTYSQVIFQSLFPDMAIYTVKRVGWWFLQTKSMSQYRLTLLVDAGGGIWTHGPLRDEVSLPHGSERRAYGLTPLAMLGNPRVCFSIVQSEIYILSIWFMIQDIMRIQKHWGQTFIISGVKLPELRRIKVRSFSILLVSRMLR